MRSPTARSLLLLALSALAAPVGAQRSFPAQRWPATTPAQVGMNVAVLDSIDREIVAGRYGYIDRLLVIRHGRIAYDKRYTQDYDRAYGDSAKVKNSLSAHDVTSPYNYFSPWWHPTYQRGDLHTLQSVTKTVTSVVIGTAVTRGEFPSLDTPVLSFFDTTTVKNIDDRKRRMTIRHLLTMSGGFDWNESLPYIDPRNTGGIMEAAYDWGGYVISLPMAREPGTQFNYSSGESQLLAHIFFRATGLDVEEYAARHLFRPLGITRWHWKRTPSGPADTEGGLYLEASDLARIWYLFLNDGMWNGTRVVSSEWVKASVAPQIATGTQPTSARYGYKWWLYPLASNPTKFAWAGSGFGGQFPIALPEKDVIIVFNAWNILPGQQGIPVRRMIERIEKAVVGR